VINRDPGKASNRLEGNSFLLTGRGQSPAAGFPSTTQPQPRPEQSGNRSSGLDPPPATPAALAMFLTTAAMAGPGSLAAPPVFTTTMATVVPLPAHQPVPSPDAFNALRAAIYGLQCQMGELLARLAAVTSRTSPSAPPPIPYGLLGFGGIPALPTSVPIISEVFSTRQVLPASSTPGPFPQPVSWAPPQPASGLLTAKESSSPAPLSSSPSPIPSFTAPNLVPPQQHCDGVFYGGVDGIQATTSELQAAVRCLLACQQGQRPIFKQRRPIVSAATILQ